MPVSKVFLFSDQGKAQEKFARHKGQINDGFNVIMVGPTDVFRITDQSPNKIEWASENENDWYMVIVTEAPVWAAGSGVVPGP